MVEAIATVIAVFVGGPKTLQDARGTWTSSIYREPVAGPVAVTELGLAGDKVTQPYHGGASAALCIHLADHYRFWRSKYGLDVGPGMVGENLTLDGVSEDQICCGDIVCLGTARIQVSGPRIPCANLARRIGRDDFVRLTIQENRPGFYARVLEPGALQQGDAWTLEERLSPDGALSAINRCAYLEFDADYARRLSAMAGLDEWWQNQFREKLAAQTDHWTGGMLEG